MLGELASLGLSFNICKMVRGGITNLSTLPKNIVSNPAVSQPRGAKVQPELLKGEQVLIV